MSVFRIFNYILVKLSSMIMFNSDLIQTMIHFLFAIAILLLLSMTRHPASVFTARFQDCEFVYHVLAQVVTMLHLTPCSPIQICTNIAYLHSGIFTLSLTRLSSRKGCGGTPLTIIFNFTFYIFNLKRISRTRQMPYSGEFFIYSHIHFVQALAKITRHREGLQAFQGEHTYQQQPFQPFQRVFLLFRGMNE